MLPLGVPSTGCHTFWRPIWRWLALWILQLSIAPFGVAQAAVLPILCDMGTSVMQSRNVANTTSATASPDARRLIELSAITGQQMVVVMPTNNRRIDIAKASRSWRGKVRAHYVIESVSNLKKLRREADDFFESYTVQPDVLGFRRAHEYRYALAPLIAHKHFGNSYEWMLFGDDDTVWSLGGVVRMLAGFDSSLPYLVSDNFWNGLEEGDNSFAAAVNPSKTAPRCLPCHFKVDKDKLTKAALLANPGCPCTPDEACAPVNLKTEGDWTRSACLRQQYRFHVFGGTGMILSHGLLTALASKELQYTECVNRHSQEYGDVIVSQCLFSLGFAATDPGPFLLAPGARPPLFGSYNVRNLPLTPHQLQRKVEAASASQADPDQVRVLLWMVSMHVKGRSVPSGDASGHHHHMRRAAVAVREMAALLQDVERLRARVHTGGKESGEVQHD